MKLKGKLKLMVVAQLRATLSNFYFVLTPLFSWNLDKHNIVQYNIYFIAYLILSIFSMLLHVLEHLASNIINNGMACTSYGNF